MWSKHVCMYMCCQLGEIVNCARSLWMALSSMCACVCVWSNEPPFCYYYYFSSMCTLTCTRWSLIIVFQALLNSAMIMGPMKMKTSTHVIGFQGVRGLLLLQQWNYSVILLTDNIITKFRSSITHGDVPESQFRVRSSSELANFMRRIPHKSRRVGID